MPAPGPKEDPRRTGSSGGDGRNISADLGVLGGEGAGQLSPVDRPGSQGAMGTAVWTHPPESAGAGSTTYYDRPLIKQPVWIWAVPVYFFCGGAAGAAAFLGETARFLGRDPAGSLALRCRWLAATGTSAGGLLLILDLGRPERFFNMLRVFRPTSAMSVGSWVLAASGAASGASAALTPRRRAKWAARRSSRRTALKKIGDGTALVSAGLGLPLASYTGVLLSDTAVPLWQQTRRFLPAVFVASSAASAAALLKLTHPDPESAAIVRNFGIIGTAAEMIGSFALERDAARIDSVQMSLTRALPGSLWKASKVLSLATLAASVGEGTSRRRQLTSAWLGIGAGLALRFALFLAGKQSAADPRASFEQQRSRQKSTGPHRRTGKILDE